MIDAVRVHVVALIFSHQLNAHLIRFLEEPLSCAIPVNAGVECRRTVSRLRYDCVDIARCMAANMARSAASRLWR